MATKFWLEMFSFIMFPWAPQEILIFKLYANDQYLMID